MNIGRLLLQKINTKQINATLHFPQKENESRKAIWSACIKRAADGAVWSSSVAKTNDCNVAKTKEACSIRRGFILAVYGQGQLFYH